VTTRRRSPFRFVKWLLACLTVAGVSAMITYQPDRPRPAIVPGSSDGPAFTVQVVRPRLGLPLGGILPPGVFGVDAELAFTSQSSGAVVGAAGPGRLELAADGWDLVIVTDASGAVGPATSVVFDLVFENRVRRVRARAADPAVGSFTATPLAGADEVSGRFDIELPRCEDAVTGEDLGWPPRPFILHGSFDRLPAVP
jgi:hypothetical protein